MSPDEWQHFTSVPPRSDRNRFHVTIGKNGNMLINRAVFERMGSPAAVHIFFNPRTAAMLLKPARPRDTGAFPSLSSDAAPTASSAQTRSAPTTE